MPTPKPAEIASPKLNDASFAQLIVWTSSELEMDQADLVFMVLCQVGLIF